MMRSGGKNMLFYKVTAMLGDEKWAEENNDRRVKEERIRIIAGKSDEYNERDRKGIYSFVSDLGRNDITCGIISPSSIDAIKLARSYFKHLGIIAKDSDVSEITFSSMKNLLSILIRMSQ